ncbi:phosphate acyltransferase PlsX [Pseudomonas sp. F1_0610]|uniref:phosphate acyltransferase PlsX n=1 Tax=Pseudomonas sp. F1_0610 TaxID=3114284 RepID=UPI0039C1D7BA
MTAPIVAVDAMGGDYGPRCIVPACITALKAHPSLKLILVGQSAVLEKILSHYSLADKQRLSVVDASECIAMDELPSQVIRGKTNSSMRVAVQLVKEAKADAIVSAGNTGALMALSRLELGTFEGIHRPAIITALPTEQGRSYMLDLGANVDCSADNLVQFALMGVAALEAEGLSSPKVALLNIGTENIKGTQAVKAADELLQRMPSVNYIGYIEGDGLFRGEADLIVCDGFVGNAILKSAEGMVQMIGGQVREQLGRGLRALLMKWLSIPVWRALSKTLKPAQYNGACLLGLNGVVIKSHGSATHEAFEYAIEAAVNAAQRNVYERMQERLAFLLAECDHSGASIIQ